jgi:hypothetical protein
VVVRGALPDGDLKRFAHMDEDAWDALEAERPSGLAPDEHELFAELLRQQGRADAAAAAALRPSLPLGSPRTHLAPALQALFAADRLHARALVLGIATAAAARLQQRHRLSLVDSPPTPRPRAHYVHPLAADGADLAGGSVAIILVDGLALGWADRLIGDLERCATMPRGMGIAPASTQTDRGGGGGGVGDVW